MKDEVGFDRQKQHILVVGSDESIVIPHALSFYNEGTEKFSDHMDSFFEDIDLPSYGHSLLTAMDKSNRI